MKPFSDVKIGDVYRNPVTYTEWYVVNKKENLIEIQMLCHDGSMSKSIWTKNSDRIFSFPLILEGID